MADPRTDIRRRIAERLEDADDSGAGWCYDAGALADAVMGLFLEISVELLAPFGGECAGYVTPRMAERYGETLDMIATAVETATDDTLRDGIRSMIRRVRPEALDLWSPPLAHRPATTEGDTVIVTVTPTIMDGTVVRWYSTEDAAEYGREMLSASRNGVAVHCYLHEVPADVLDDAQRAYEAMCRGRRANVSHLATHRRRGWRGPLEPITTAPTRPTPLGAEAS